MKENFIKELIVWIKDHKKQLIVAGVSFPVVITTALGLKNMDSVKKLFNDLKVLVENGSPYSDKWFKNISNDVLESEKNKVRIDYYTCRDNYNKSERLERLLNRFDDEISNRTGGTEKPHAPKINREHGWYLPNDD